MIARAEALFSGGAGCPTAGTGPAHRPSAVVERAEGERTVAELSPSCRRASGPEGTIHRWPHKGLVRARKTTALDRDLWLVRPKDALAHDRRRRPRRPTTIAPVP